MDLGNVLLDKVTKDLEVSAKGPFPCHVHKYVFVVSMVWLLCISMVFFVKHTRMQMAADKKCKHLQYDGLHSQ